MQKQVKVRTSFVDKPAIIKSIDTIAEAHGSSRSDVIRAALRDYIDNIIRETASKEYVNALSKKEKT